jgi:hypothetical protein
MLSDPSGVVADQPAPVVSASSIPAIVPSAAAVPVPVPADAPVAIAVPVPVPADAPVAIAVPVPVPADAPVAIAVPVPVPADAPASAPTPTAISAAIDTIVKDLSGANLSAGDIARYLPRLAAQVHALNIPGADKSALVVAAAHVLVDRCVPEGERTAAHALTDAVFPAAIAGIIDVVRGRVTFQQAVAASMAAVPELVPIVAPMARNCLMSLLSVCKK